MRCRRLTLAIVSLVIGSAGATYGQTNVREPARRFLGGSVFLSDLHAHRERRSPVDTSSTSELDGIGSSGPGGAIAIGVDLSRHFAFEGEWSVAPAIHARQIRLLRGFTTSHRDKILSLVLKHPSGPEHRIGVEPLVGLSVAYGDTRLTNVEQFRTFCDGGMIRHCAVPAPDVPLGSRVFIGFAAGAHTAVRANARTAFVFSARVDHWFGRNADLGDGRVLETYKLGLASTMLRVAFGTRLRL